MLLLLLFTFVRRKIKEETELVGRLLEHLGYYSFQDPSIDLVQVHYPEEKDSDCLGLIRDTYHGNFIEFGPAEKVDNLCGFSKD